MGLIPVKASKYRILQPIMVEVRERGIAFKITDTESVIIQVNIEEAKKMFDAYVAASNSNKKLFDVDLYISNNIEEELTD